MREDVHIRVMAEADWPRMAAIYTAALAGGNATFETQCPPWAAWDAARLPSPRLVAEQNGLVVGFAALNPVSARAVYAGVAEVTIYVDAAAQGAGIGTALLRALCEAADAAGLWTLQAAILQENTPSLRLHARCGFRTVGVRERLGRDRFGTWRNVVLMERRNTME